MTLIDESGLKYVSREEKTWKKDRIWHCLDVRNIQGEEMTTQKFPKSKQVIGSAEEAQVLVQLKGIMLGNEMSRAKWDWSKWWGHLKVHG